MQYFAHLSIQLHTHLSVHFFIFVFFIFYLSMYAVPGVLALADYEQIRPDLINQTVKRSKGQTVKRVL